MPPFSFCSVFDKKMNVFLMDYELIGCPGKQQLQNLMQFIV